MIHDCAKCHVTYDDCVSTTICPHERFISDEDATRKDLACSLLGKDVRFNHQPDGPYYRIQSVSFEGMVELRGGVTGEFAPHLFVVKA